MTDMTMSSAAPDPGEDVPDWAFSRGQDVHCPECGALLSGLDWARGEPGIEDIVMHLFPCGHELPTYAWELKFYGRGAGGARFNGIIVRKPVFVRKPRKK